MLGLSFVVALVGAEPLPTCAFDDTPLMTQDFQTFDQTEGGWRHIARQGCYDQAARVIARYRDLNGEDLRPGQLSSLEWHQGQMHAYVGEYEAAIHLFEATYDTTDDRPEMVLKIDGTLAFLRRDRAALEAAYDALMALPEPDGFSAAIARFRTRFPDREPPTWPLNQRTMERYLACFEHTYAIAYEGQCEAVAD